MPDLCIVVGWYWIIKPDLLNKVPHGILGIHASLLPEYRGSAPLIWPIINGDKKSGVTLFYFDEGLDTGDIVGQKEFKIDDNDSVTEIMKKAEALIEQLLEEYYPLLLESKAPRFKQDHSKATYCSRRTPEDGCINWNLTNVEIHNLIRAQTHPYPGAFCSYGENRLYLWKSSLFRQPYHGIPGMVTQTMGDKVVIACGKGAVILHEVQLENSTSKAAGDILKYGTRLK